MDKITNYNEESILQKTSLTLMLPTLYGYYIGNYDVATFNLISCLISGLFWYNPYKGIRRNIDLIYQPLFSSYMLILGNTSSTNRLSMFIGNSLFLGGTYLYSKSCEAYKIHNRFWHLYHGFFHISMSSACFFAHAAISKKHK